MSGLSQILVTPGAVYAEDTFTRLANPTDLPTGSGNKVACSPDSTYMAITNAGSPSIIIYKRSGDTFTKLPDPATLPVAATATVAFSPDSTYMVVAHVGSPYITIYKRSGDTFTKLTDPLTLPSSAGIGVAFSHDSTYMAVAIWDSPYITIYKRSGDTFTKLPDPAALPVGAGWGVAFSHDSTYMAVAHAGSPYITIYKRSGDTFSKLPDPATLPTNSGLGVAFSPDSTYMAVAHDSSPYITTYKRSGDTFTKLDNPLILPADTGRDVAFSPNSTYMAVAHDSSPGITIYRRSGDIFTKLPDPATPPAGTGYGVAFSPDSTYMAVACADSPFIAIYKIVASPSFVSAATSISGATITITFDKDMADPAGKQGEFSYRIGAGAPQNFSAAALGADNTKIRLTCSGTSIAYSDTVTVSYTKGTVTSADTGVLETFTGRTVTNNMRNPAKAITAFNFNELSPAVIGTINEGAKTIALTVPFGTDVTALVPTITHTGESINPASGAANNFTTPQIYTVTAADTSTQEYTVTVTVALNPAKAITAFNFNGLSPSVIGTVNEGAKTVALIVPFGTDVIALVPTITHTGASINPVSGAANNFTTPQIYTVTAADTSTQAYTVTVTVAARSLTGADGQTSHGGSPGAGSLVNTPTVSIPSIQTQSASLSANSVVPGTAVTVTADIINNGKVNSSKKVTVYVNGEVETTRGVTVNGGSSSQLTFNVSRSEPGNYMVYVDGVPAGSFKVELLRESDGILIVSVTMLAGAFVVGMIMLRRNQIGG